MTAPALQPDELRYPLRWASFVAMPARVCLVPLDDDVAALSIVRGA